MPSLPAELQRLDHQILLLTGGSPLSSSTDSRKRISSLPYMMSGANHVLHRQHRHSHQQQQQHRQTISINADSSMN